jgi:hypothetical protein
VCQENPPKARPRGQDLMVNWNPFKVLIIAALVSALTPSCCCQELRHVKGSGHEAESSPAWKQRHITVRSVWILLLAFIRDLKSCNFLRIIVYEDGQVQVQGGSDIPDCLQHTEIYTGRPRSPETYANVFLLSMSLGTLVLLILFSYLKALTQI